MTAAQDRAGEILSRHISAQGYVPRPDILLREIGNALTAAREEGRREGRVAGLMKAVHYIEQGIAEEARSLAAKEKDAP